MSCVKKSAGAPLSPICLLNKPFPAKYASWIVLKSSSECAHANPYANSVSVLAYMCGTPKESLRISIFSTLIFCEKSDVNEKNNISCKIYFMLTEI